MNYALLISMINRSKASKGDIARQLGLTRQGFRNKLNGVREVKVSEINILSQILELSTAEKDAIFFADYVDRSANTN